jgi:hypothetical protein
MFMILITFLMMRVVFWYFMNLSSIFLINNSILFCTSLFLVEDAISFILVASIAIIFQLFG